ncbi:MAG: hypothetical protein QOI06_2866 [Nocardioidaceae bacterium]|nr:hypothetical protein [Nocardioidaceae bacterium]
MLSGMEDWTLGLCANCRASLDFTAPAALFCSERCRGYAKDVRYFRACHADGRVSDPDVVQALKMRMAHRVVGGYNAAERRVDPGVRSTILAANDSLCRMCNSAQATEVDHIEGPSSRAGNLQGLCHDCHMKKTEQRFGLMTPEHAQVRDAFMLRVYDDPPSRACDDERSWNERWPVLLAETREWCERESGNLDAGYFGDGSTGTVDDFEHGIYLQKLAERDD